jgi:myo-inositol-1(or 4)-monophosphatase
MPDSEILERIEQALREGARVASRFTPANARADRKSSDQSIVTQADLCVNRMLRELLLRNEEGWLSEEDPDDLQRLRRRRVWVVDPLDGTREFMAGIPEWAISVALVEDGQAVAGGICNPGTGESFLGSKETAVTYNGSPARVSDKQRLEGAVVLASRTEVERGEWACYENEGFIVRPMGSVAYKLARIAAGLADATWTFDGRNEWDIAGGVALLEAAGSYVQLFPNARPTFNRKSARLPGLFACGPLLRDPVAALLGVASRPPPRSHQLPSNAHHLAGSARSATRPESRHHYRGADDTTC